MENIYMTNIKNNIKKTSCYVMKKDDYIIVIEPAPEILGERLQKNIMYVVPPTDVTIEHFKDSDCIETIARKLIDIHKRGKN